MNGLKLRATGRALPSRVLTNEDMRQFVDTSDEWITTRTGIRQRYFCGENESTTTLAIAAAKQALERSGVAKEEIGCLLVATSSGEYAMPSTACLVHAALELPENIPVMDVGAACAGFLYAMEVARGLLLANQGRYAIVVGAEQMSFLQDMTDRGVCVLFGDGAGAAVLEFDPDAEYVSVQGSRGDLAITVGGPQRKAYMQMEGQAVFRFATTILPQCAKELMEKGGKTIEDVDWVVCHQ
ncbi:MAG: beta-ketoacyl-ACP synthase 3, partial [Clostridia bacterium]|nr:beta-ketoacyl-ACP synthase 3 [Clostridia bacterium]